MLSSVGIPLQCIQLICHWLQGLQSCCACVRARVWQPTVTLPWISGSYQSSQAPTFGPCRRACICVVGRQGKTGGKAFCKCRCCLLLVSVSVPNQTKMDFLCTSIWTCFGEKLSVHANFPSVTLSWKACLFKQSITWDDVCGTEGLPQEKVLRGYVRIPLPSHVIMNFPPLCLTSMLLSSGKYLNTRNKCHCLSLTVAQTVIVESSETPMLFLLGFWSIWSLFKSNNNPLLERRIPVRSAGPCSCWAHTRKEGRGGLTDGERKSRLRPPPTAMENSDLPARICCKERRKVVFLSQPRWDLATSCCETAILQGEISWAALPAWETLQAFYATKEGNGNTQKAFNLAK